MKKIFICLAVLSCILVTGAYAQEEETDVLDAEETDEPVLLSETAGEDVDLPSDHFGDSDPADDLLDEEPGSIIQDEDTLHVVETPEPEEVTNQEVPSEPAIIFFDIEEATPEPEETPEAETMTFEEETLYTLGRIEGLLIFFAVVLLCFFAYKFFRMFF